jgi:hypothetical protein
MRLKSGEWPVGADGDRAEPAKLYIQKHIEAFRAQLALARPKTQASSASHICYSGQYLPPADG